MPGLLLIPQRNRCNVSVKHCVAAPSTVFFSSALSCQDEFQILCFKTSSTMAVGRTNVFWGPGVLRYTVYGLDRY